MCLFLIFKMQKIWNHFPFIKYPFYFLLWGVLERDICLQLINLILYNYSILFKVFSTTINMFINVFESLTETMNFYLMLFFMKTCKICRIFLYLAFNSLLWINWRFFIKSLHEKLQIQTLLGNSKHIKQKLPGTWTNLFGRQNKCCHSIVIRKSQEPHILWHLS